MRRSAVLHNEERPLLGMGLMLAAFFFFSWIDTGVKWLVMAGLPPLQLAFMRYFGHLVISSSLVFHRGFQWSELRSGSMGLVILRSIMLALSTVLNFIAIQYLPITLTSTILFLAPVLVCVLSWPMLGERVGQFRTLAILAGFAGILVAIRPFGAEFHWAAFLSLGAATCFAVYSILTRMLSERVSSDLMQFYSGVVGTVAMLPLALGTWVLPKTGLEWIVFICLGIFGWIGHELLTRAYRFAPANKLVPFSYSFMIYIAIWSFLLFGDLPDIWVVIGATIVAAAGIAIWARELYLARHGRLR
ncbi:DMT family transporter [Amaricoccus tamworthensis]|uniref:DMT family transporter n=1 Tax=Amaricoccus tamworthensis TaxID=57002 RepID=UPI003C7AF8B5